MKNTYITVVVLVLVVGGFLVFMGKGNKVEAPETSNIEKEDAGVVSNTMPVLEGDTSVTEMVVAEVKEFTVTGANFSFNPSSITVKKGDRVKITFINSEGFHDWKIDEFGAATKQTKAPTTEVLEFTADKVGSFEYYCSVGSHKAMGMVGTLKVE